MSHGGKGSRARPYSVTNDEYSQRWDAIFGRDLDKKPPPEPSMSPEVVPVENTTDPVPPDK
jgi:hypothetical protein